MGLIALLLGLVRGGNIAGGTLREAADALVGNKAEEARLENAEFSEVLKQFGAEFAGQRLGWFDRFVDAMNRLPRPVLAFGTMALFGFAMAAPQKFAVRMEGLALVPEPLWWLMGAIISFYFGARELQYRRDNVSIERLRRDAESLTRQPEAEVPVAATDPDYNAAVAEWQALQNR
jgi:Holin of 3TMs, for gene-transfer release